METAEMIEEMRRGRYVVWLEDETTEHLIADYLAEHPEYVAGRAVKIVDTISDGYDLCTRLHDEETERKGKATTKYRISNLLTGEDHYSMRVTKDELSRMVRRLPISPEDLGKILKGLKEG